MWQALSLEAALYIVRNMRDLDRDCLRSMIGDFSVEMFALNRYQTEGAAWVYYQDGVPVFMGGIAQMVPWSGVAWIVSIDGITTDSWKKIIRFTRKVLSNASREYHRIDAHVISTWPQAQKYAAKVGFKHVSTKERAGREGQNVLEFAIIGAKQ